MSNVSDSGGLDKSITIQGVENGTKSFISAEKKKETKFVFSLNSTAFMWLMQNLV